MDDVILYWNDIALEANRVSHTNGKEEQTGPTLSSRALAIVHLAMYDAFIGISPSGFAPYLTNPAVPAPAPGASLDAAVAAAAYTTLSSLFPSQKPFFDLVFDETHVSDLPIANGHTYGKAVANRILTLRQGDPGASPLDYKPKPGRGKHRADPDNPGQSFHGAKYGAANLFACKTRHELAEPPDVSTGPGVYRNALRQVRGKGIAPELMGTIAPAGRRRTENESVIGLYWAYDGAFGLGTPPRLYNQILRLVAQNVPHPGPGGTINTAAENARMFALANTAMADAGILAWEQKYKYEFWRPVLGIREHDPSMGPEGVAGNAIDPDCDPGWLPFGAPNTNRLVKNVTPPFPAYPSGHATFGAAAFHIARRFYGVGADNTAPDKLFKDTTGKKLSFVSEELNGVNTDNKGAVRPKHKREFPDGLWQMIIENGFSRVYLGVHWSYDSFALDNDDDPKLDEMVDGKLVGGVPLGILIANDIFGSGMTAVNTAPPLPPAMAMAEAAGAAEAISLSAEAPRLPWPLG